MHLVIAREGNGDGLKTHYVLRDGVLGAINKTQSD